MSALIFGFLVSWAKEGYVHNEYTHITHNTYAIRHRTHIAYKYQRILATAIMIIVKPIYAVVSTRNQFIFCIVMLLSLRTIAKQWLVSFIEMSCFATQSDCIIYPIHHAIVCCLFICYRPYFSRNFAIAASASLSLNALITVSGSIAARWPAFGTA